MRVTVISPLIYTYGAMLISGVLRDAGYDVTLRRDLDAGDADVVLLSLYSTMHLLDGKIRSFVRSRHDRGATTYAGGPVSAYPEIVMGELDLDAVVVGEGEETVIRLLDEGVAGDLDGIAYREGGEVSITPPARHAPMERPLPLIPDDIGGQSIRGANVYVETHRGCIGACTFCQVPRFFGRTIRSRSIADVLAEVRAFRDKGVRRISISGGTGSLYGYSDGTFNTTAFVELLEGMAEVMGNRNVSSPDIRVDCINDEILEAIRRYTIGWIFFGIESGSDRILRLMGKGVTTDQVVDAVSACRRHDLKVAGSFITGYPTETDEEYQETKDLIEALSPDDVFVSAAEPIPGTPLADLVLKTPDEENPAFVRHTGDYRSLNLMENEARAFDLMMHADLFKPGLHVVTAEVFDSYLNEARGQGRDIRAVSDLLFRYGDHVG